MKKEYHQALAEASYQQAKEKLLVLQAKLQKSNRQAANALAEGMEELLTLHKLELAKEFSVSFSTTNCIESVNAQLKKHVGRVTRWSSSDQRYRWVASALLEIEQRMRKVDNFKALKKMKKAIAKHIQTQTAPS